MIQVHPKPTLRGSVRVPSSKPHCQRAILLATMAAGESWIQNTNTCSETEIIAEACREFGATLEYHESRLRIIGVGGKLRRPEQILNVAGSGFALRNLLALASLASGPTILTGNQRMSERPYLPLVERLTAMGTRIETVDPALPFPLVNWGGRLRGGTHTVSAETTSQFATALLLVAPYADAPSTFHLPGPIVGKEYIHMTVSLMRAFGAEAEATEDLRRIDVQPGGYRSRDVCIGPDVNALFYFIAAAVAVDTDMFVADVQLGCDPMLDAAVAVGRAMGVVIEQRSHGVQITSGPAPRQQVQLHMEHLPTLVPAVAAVALRLPHGVRVTGARHLRFHKTSRLEALLDKLDLLGHHLEPIYSADELDGFETHSIRSSAIDAVDSHGDHRLFMALVLASLGADRPIAIAGEETLSTSFADFIECFTGLGAHIAEPTTQLVTG